MTRLAAIIVWSIAASAACGGGGGASPTSPSSSSTTAGSSSGGGSGGGNNTPDTTAPVFSTPFLRMEDAVAFYIFGETLPSAVQNPTFEIETADQTTPVYAVAAGTVINITNSSNGVDKTVFIFPSSNSIWDVSYDHVMNLRVSIGQTVTAGMQIGTVGILNNGRGRTELQINRTDQTPVLAHCPTNFGTSSFNSAFTAAAQRIKGNSTVCSAQTVRP